MRIHITPSGMPRSCDVSTCNLSWRGQGREKDRHRNPKALLMSNELYVWIPPTIQSLSECQSERYSHRTGRARRVQGKIVM